jgi:hypothetical protein
MYGVELISKGRNEHFVINKNRFDLKIKAKQKNYCVRSPKSDLGSNKVDGDMLSLQMY